MSVFSIVKSRKKKAILVDQQITNFNSVQIPFTKDSNPMVMNYIIKEDGVVIASINSDLYHGGMLYISEIFVDERFKGRCLGSQLLEHTESEARSLGGTLSHCDTSDLQTKDFYLKQGYSVFGILKDCPPDQQRYYLRKKLFNGEDVL